MEIIDLQNEDVIYELEEQVKRKQEEQLEKGKYTIDDFALVRAADYLEEDHVLKPICSIPFVTNVNSVASSAIFQIMQEKNNVDIYNDEEYDKLKELANNYTPLSSQYRSTIHFTLNGLVASHDKGSFDSRNFIIIDRLNKHLGVDNIKTIRMEDTFVSDKFALSNESIVLINKNKYSELIEKYPWLETYNVVLFEGDEKKAVESTLIKMGITPETIETHSAKYSERTPLYEECLTEISKEYGIEREKHYYSKENKEDDEKNLKLWEIYDRYFYQSLVSHFTIDETIGDNTIEFLSSPKNDRYKQEDTLKTIIKTVGIEEYCNFVVNYNQEIMKAIDSGIFPSNDEILSSGQITLKEKNKVY